MVRLYKKILSIIGNAAQKKLLSTMSELEDENKEFRLELSKRFDCSFYIPVSHKGTNWHSIEEKDGFRFGKLGAMVYIIDDGDLAISDGFHTIDTKRKRGQIGAGIYLLDHKFRVYGTL
jgi:hypothetical protein